MTGADTAVITPGVSADPSRSALSHRLDTAMSQMAAACEHARELLTRAECALIENRMLRQAISEALHDQRATAARQDLLQRSEYARMAARLQTLPVIEQAKGIIMAQSHCGAAEAFDTLRRASQRSNIPVRELAARLVANAAA